MLVFGAFLGLCATARYAALPATALAVNRWVAGSNPARGAKFSNQWSIVPQLLAPASGQGFLFPGRHFTENLRSK